MDTTEFALAETHEPHLFVVRKQQRQSAAAGTSMAWACLSAVLVLCLLSGCLTSVITAVRLFSRRAEL
jgi:hypothetical protein